MHYLDSILSDDLIVSHLDSISIISSSSPEGNAHINNKLALSRGKVLKTYILNNCSHIKSSGIYVLASTADWGHIRSMIEADSNFSDRESVVNAITADVSPATIE